MLNIYIYIYIYTSIFNLIIINNYRFYLMNIINVLLIYIYIYI